MAWSPDGTRIVSGSYDNTLRIWDAQSGQAIGEPLTGHSGYVIERGLESRRNAHRLGELATTPSGSGTRKADKPSENLLPDIQSHVSERGLESRRYAHRLGEWRQHPPDLGRTKRTSHRRTSYRTFRVRQERGLESRRNAHRLGEWDKTLRIWDAQSGQAIGEPLTGHSEAILSVAWSPDGVRIVSGSDDNTLWLWDAQSGQAIGEPLTGHSDSVRSVAWSPDGTQIVSGSSDETLRIWKLSQSKKINLATYLECQYLEAHEDGFAAPETKPNIFNKLPPSPILNRFYPGLDTIPFENCEARLNLLLAARNWPQLFRELQKADPAKLSLETRHSIAVSLLATTSSDWKQPGASRIHLLFPHLDGDRV